MKHNKPSKEELYKLREHYTREYIAEMYKVSISTIRRWVQSYGLQRRRRETPKPLPMRRVFDSGVTVIEKAKRKLGSRLTETKLGYRLDGRPCNIDDVLKAAGLT